MKINATLQSATVCKFKILINVALILPLTIGVSPGFTEEKSITQKLSVPYDSLLIPSSMQFSVTLKKIISGQTALDGDLVESTLKDDLMIGDKLIAPKDSDVLGHVSEITTSRRLAKALVTERARFHKNGTMVISLDEIVTPEGQHIRIVGIISKQTIHIAENTHHPRQVKVGTKGDVIQAEEVLSSDDQAVVKVVRVAVHSALAQLGTAASFGAVPIVMGILGAASPALVTGKPVSSKDKHPRVKGFLRGVLTSVPGGPVAGAFIFKGSDLTLKPGDEFLVQAHSPYDELPTTANVSSIILKK